MSEILAAYIPRDKITDELFDFIDGRAAFEDKINDNDIYNINHLIQWYMADLDEIDFFDPKRPKETILNELQSIKQRIRTPYFRIIITNENET